MLIWFLNMPLNRIYSDKLAPCLLPPVVLTKKHPTKIASFKGRRLRWSVQFAINSKWRPLGLQGYKLLR